MLGKLHEGWSLIEPLIASYGALAIFVMIYFESFGAPLPGETGMIAAAILATKGELSIAGVFAAALAGALLGDSTGYLIGRIGGRALLHRFEIRGGRFQSALKRADENIVEGSGLQGTGKRFRLRFTIRAKRIVRLNGEVAGYVSVGFGMSYEQKVQHRPS